VTSFVMTIRAIRVREAGDWRGHPPAGQAEQAGRDGHTDSGPR
jgi:hypothetical protein